MSEIDDAITHLKTQTTLAVVALGTALAQTVVELDELSPILTNLRSRAEALHAHLEGQDHQDAADMVGAFVRALYTRRFFPGDPENRY
jgi:hypothetical protein